MIAPRHLTGWRSRECIVYFGDGGISLHACGDPDIGPELQVERARLIAAAPTLLAACRSAIVALKGREHDGFLRDAIEAATGVRP